MKTNRGKVGGIGKMEEQQEEKVASGDHHMQGFVPCNRLSHVRSQDGESSQDGE